jgi:DNA repair protein RecO (recombination protein O)
MLLEVMTAELGRISLVARGARRRKRGGSAGALLQPFVPLLIGYSGRSELKNLTATESAGPPQVLRGQRMFSGLYLNELLVRLLHRHDPHPQLFAAYAATLDALAASGELDDILRRFEFTLLVELGYGFELGVDGRSGDVLRPGDWYHYHPDYGLVARGPVTDPAQPAFRGADLLAIAANDFSGEARPTAKRLFRLVLAMHLGDAPLRSRELFRTHGSAVGPSEKVGLKEQQ